MSKYHIKPKRDFGSGRGFYVRGRFVKTGFVVVRDFCNCMPGGTWFETIPQALEAIRVLEHSNGDSQRFWRLLHRINGTTQRSRNEQKQMCEALNLKLVKKTKHADGGDVYYYGHA